MNSVRHISVLPCALLTFALIAGCSSSHGEQDNAQPAPSTSQRQGSGHGPSPSTAEDEPAGGQSTATDDPAPSDARQDDDAEAPQDESPAADAPPESADPSDRSAKRYAPAREAQRRFGDALPQHGESVLDGRRMVALYGTPGTSSLGVLGEQPLGAAVERVRRLADRYGKLTDDQVVPAFELIATIASTSAGEDGDFSTELSLSTLRPWVERAAKDGIYVVLDLQPGRTDFVTQAKRYAPLLAYPNVGLALDPEWRLGPKQRHLEQIGSVRAAEVNATIDWLAELTRREKLPQKLVILHQFSTQMIAARQSVQADRDNVTVLIHADGQGTQAAKRGTWRTLHKHAPRGVRWGWKNFIDEDHPMLTPKQTYAIRPAPDFVSYQ